jgi:hypothetical protein
MMFAALALHELLCAALFYSVFCRAVQTSAGVKLDVRLAFFALGAVALAGIVAPLALAFVPGGWPLALLSAIVLVQLITARHWRHGVPAVFLADPPACKKA